MLQPQTKNSVPEETARVARVAFPKGNLYMTMRSEIGTVYSDKDFETLFPTHGQPAFSPWRLALVCVMQIRSELSDRQALQLQFAVGGKWRYAQWSAVDQRKVLIFRCCASEGARLVTGDASQQLLDTLLKQFKEFGWLKERGKQRTDSTHMLAAIRTLNRLEGVGETLRAVLNALATVAPDWLRSWVPDEWFDRYERAVDEYRLPKGIAARSEYAETIGREGMQLLIVLYDEQTTPQWLRQIPVVDILRQKKDAPILFR